MKKRASVTISHSSAAEPGRPVLVIGGRGFVGSQVVRELIARGCRPHLFGPPMEDDLLADLAGRFEETIGSIEDAAALQAVLQLSGAHSILTTAAFSAGRQGLMRSGEADRARALAVNVSGFNTLLDAAHAAGANRVVWTSSTVVYGFADRYGSDPVDEDAPLHPQTFYGLTKAMAEQLARFHRERSGIAVTGLRLPLVLGPGLWYQGAASAIAAIAGEAAPGAVYRTSFHDAPIDLMHVADAAAALVDALLGPRNSRQAVYNINGFTARISDIARAAEKAVPGYRVEIETVDPPFLFPLISDHRFREEYGFQPRHDLAGVIRDMLPRKEMGS